MSNSDKFSAGGLNFDAAGATQAAAAVKTLKVSLDGLPESELKAIGVLKEMSAEAQAAQAANLAALGSLAEFAGKAAGLGDAVGAIGKGLAGGPIGVAMALGDLATKYVNDYTAAIDQASEAQDKLNFDEHAESIARLAASWNQAQASIAGFNAALATAGGQGDPTQKQIENTGQAASAEEAAARRTIVALGAIEEARLRAGGGSAAAIAGVAAATQQQLDQRQIAADAAPVTALQDEQKTRTAQDPALRTAALKAMDEANAKKKGVEDMQNKLAEAQKRAQPGGELDTNLDAANSELDTAQALDDNVYMAGPDGMGTMVHNTLKDDAVAEAQSKLKVATTDRDVTRRQIDRLKKDLPTAEFDADVATALADKKKNEAITNAGRLVDLPGEITQAQTIAAFKTEGDAAMVAPRTIAADKAAGAHIDSARSLQAANEQQARSKQLADELGVAARQAAAAHSESLTKIRELLDQINQANVDLKRQIQNAHFNGM